MPRHLEATYVLENAYSILKSLAPTNYCSNELRNYLQKVHHQLKEWFLKGANTEELLVLHTQIIDEILINVWQQQAWQDNDQIALLAVGGYGRKVLHPHSDIDITIVIADKVSENPKHLAKIQTFMACLWDSKLKLGHSVRSLSLSLQQAEQDLATFTSLLEGRLLYGNAQLAQELSAAIYKLCSTQHFIHLKYAEFKERYTKYAIPPYTLEPDIKHSPGGLRDIQLIEWFINFIYKTQEPETFLYKLFTPEEQQAWLAAKKYLNTIRYARHITSTHHGDQLIFDCQLNMGELFENDANKKNNVIVSDFMRQYFINTRKIAHLTQRGLQLLQAAQLPPSIAHLNHPVLKLENGEIGFLKEQQSSIVLEPWRLFEIFTIFSENPQAYQICVHSQRLIEKYQSVIPRKCYLDPQYQQLFLRILTTPKVASTLELLHQYGLLSKYITEFAYITGMMQYDLFHAYPVDQHTLLLVKNLADSINHPNTLLFPLAATVAQQIAKPEILYLVGIFHDIGKGRGGAHEEIGANLIQEFAQAHHFTRSEIELMRWLVQEHLLLSHTAQHQDITNPAIIAEFAARIKDSNTLNYLYLLTIADIYATNNKLWTAWRSSLIDTLYQETSRVLQEIQHYPQKNQDIIAAKQQEALLRVTDEQQKIAIQNLWQQFSSDYFLSRLPSELTQQAHYMLTEKTLPIIAITQHHTKTATEIFIYTQQHEKLFLAITSLLAKLQLSIVAADINTTTQNYNLGTYIVLQRDNKLLDNEIHINRVIARLKQQLQNMQEIQTPELKHLSTRLQALDYPSVINFAADAHTNCTTLSLFTPDRPGLLANIAEVCCKQHMQIHRAQVNTLGERAEDIFWLLNAQQQPLSGVEQASLEMALKEVLAT